MFIDKPDAIEGLEATKQSSRVDNCTIFKIPSQGTLKCKHTYNIYAYDASKKPIQEFLNKVSQEVSICNNRKLFENIEFAKVVGVWMGETGEEMIDFVAVKSTGKKSK